MRVAFFGSRSVVDKEFVYRKLATVYGGLVKKGHKQFVFMYGRDRGVSRLVESWANTAVSYGQPIEPVLFEPYHLLNKKAEFDARNFYYRNLQMLHNADLVVVFYVPGEKGEVARAIDKAKELGKPLALIEYNMDMEEVA